MEYPSQEALIQELRLCQDENRKFRSRLTRIIKWIRVLEAQGTKIPNELKKDLDLNFESESLRNQPLPEHLELKIERTDEPDEVEAEDVDMDYFFGPLKGTIISEPESSYDVQTQTCTPKTLSASNEHEIRIVDIKTIVNPDSKLSAAAGTSHENTQNQNQLPAVVHPVEPAKPEQNFNCRDCTAEFSTVYELIAHAMIHLTPHLIPSNTNSVTKSVKKKPAIANTSKPQLKSIRNNSCQRRLKEPLTRCPKCRVFLKNAAALSVHLARAHEGKLYQCDICLKVVRSKSSCNAHFQIHHGDCINSIRMEDCFTDLFPADHKPDSNGAIVRGNNQFPNVSAGDSVQCRSPRVIGVKDKVQFPSIPQIQGSNTTADYNSNPCTIEDTRSSDMESKAIVGLSGKDETTPEMDVLSDMEEYVPTTDDTTPADSQEMDHSFTVPVTLNFQPAPSKAIYGVNALIQEMDEGTPTLSAYPCRYCFGFHNLGECVVLGVNYGNPSNKAIIAANKDKLGPVVMRALYRERMKRRHDNKRRRRAEEFKNKFDLNNSVL